MKVADYANAGFVTQQDGEGEQPMSWMRHRFKANEDDYRPVKFPPPGPYWCTGYGEGCSVVVAYLPVGVKVKEWWPEALDIDSEPCAGPEFSDRFRKPIWWV